MVGEEHRAQLHEHLTVWQGPPHGDVAKYPSLLLELCKQACADAVIVDSLKDAAVGLSADEVGPDTTGHFRTPALLASGCWSSTTSVKR